MKLDMTGVFFLGANWSFLDVFFLLLLDLFDASRGAFIVYTRNSVFLDGMQFLVLLIYS